MALLQAHHRIIALCLTFFLYQYIRTGKRTKIRWIVRCVARTLGIGVMPYAFNKVSDAMGK